MYKRNFNSKKLFTDISYLRYNIFPNFSAGDTFLFF